MSYKLAVVEEESTIEVGIVEKEFVDIGPSSKSAAFDDADVEDVSCDGTDDASAS